MLKHLLPAILAGSLALTSAAPAQANDLRRDDRAAALLLGLTALAIIGAAANQHEQNRKRDKERARERDRERERARQREQEVIVQRARPLPRVLPYEGHRGQVRALTVPSSCARRVETDRGLRTAFGAPCLRRAGVDTARLPDRCERRVDIGRGVIPAWGARCLSRAGVRID